VAKPMTELRSWHCGDLIGYQRHVTLSPLASFGSMTGRTNGASVEFVVSPHMVMDFVASKASLCTMTTGRGLPA
jgi:hypothetical protein